jgi:sarcosine/dimethylglycine N-methyltransferase
MGDEIHSAIDFYNRHPITAGIVLAKLQQARGHLDDLKPDELLAHDQDHYGGTGATDALARLAHIGAGTHGADLGGGRFAAVKA